MKYKEERCTKCNEETVHRIFRRFGRSDKRTGRKHMKREVIWCMKCQKRVIRK